MTSMTSTTPATSTRIAGVGGMTDVAHGIADAMPCAGVAVVQCRASHTWRDMAMAKHKKGAPPVKQPSGIALVAGWPVFEALLSQEWSNPEQLTLALVARRSPNTGKLAAGSFLVDRACLGVKSAQVFIYKNPDEYRTGMRRHVMGLMPMAPAPFDLVAKVILTGLDYAAALGFRPDPVFAQAEHLLAGADVEGCTTPVSTGGVEGKPHFINGPNDDVGAVIAQLRRAVGDGNFHYTLQTGGDFMPETVDEWLGPGRIGG
jgi:hypothetical protein